MQLILKFMINNFMITARTQSISTPIRDISGILTWK